MAAKLVIALVALVIIVIGTMAIAFWYFNQEAERQYEKDKRQMEQTEKIWDTIDDDDL